MEKQKRMKTIMAAGAIGLAVALGLSACGKAAKEQSQADTKAEAIEKADKTENTETTETADKTEKAEKTEIQVFVAASLSKVMEEAADKYREIRPDVTVCYNADSSGKLLTQIQEGYACDVFFSAAQKQMDALEADDRLVEGTRNNVVNNQVCVISRKGSGTQVTGLKNIGKATSIALADGSVPVGKYTREAMVRSGLLKETEDVSGITTAEVSEQLGGVEISEQSNVSKVLAAVVEGSCEVGTTYYSDLYGYEDQIDVLEKLPYELSGDVIYPIAQVKNEEADDREKEASLDFIRFVTSEDMKNVFQSHYFDTNVQR